VFFNIIYSRYFVAKVQQMNEFPDLSAVDWLKINTFAVISGST